MRKRFLLMGNDIRQRYLKELLEQRGYMTELVQDIENVDVGRYDGILLPVSDSPGCFNLIKDKLKKNQYVFGCNVKNLQEKEVTAVQAEAGVKVIEYMQQDSVAYKNAVATAEGAVAEAIIRSGVNLYGSSSLLLGYGRCGKVLADRLVRMYSLVTVMERKKTLRAEAETNGCRAVEFSILPFLQREGRKYDYVFNTVPAMVLDSHSLSLLNRNVTIIDIASKPGGVDYEYCKLHHINAVNALGLPGKYAPKTSAGILLEVIEEAMGVKEISSR